MADHDQLKQNTQSSRADESGRMMVDKKPPTVAVCGPIACVVLFDDGRNCDPHVDCAQFMHVQIHTLQFNHSQKEMLEPC